MALCRSFEKECSVEEFISKASSPEAADDGVAADEVIEVDDVTPRF